MRYTTINNKNSMYTIYYKDLKQSKLTKRESMKPGCWVHSVTPDKKELKTLSEEFKLDISLLHDALDPFEVPRLEHIQDKLYIFTRCPILEEKEIITVPILIILSDEFLVTVTDKTLPFLDKFQRNKVDFFTTQKVKLLLQIFFSIHAQYHEFITIINKSIKRKRVNLEKISNHDISQFIHFEETINEFITDLIPTGVILTNLLSGNMVTLFEEDKDLVEDLLLSNNELINLSRAKLKSLINIRNAYSTIMTNNLNQVMRVLTGLTVILMVPTIITGAYGMNISLPYADSPFAFVGLIAFTTIVSIILLFLFIKNRWF